MSCLEADQHVIDTSAPPPSTSTSTSTNDKSSSVSSSSPTSVVTTPRYFAAHQYEYEVSPEQPTRSTLSSPLQSSQSSSRHATPADHKRLQQQQQKQHSSSSATSNTSSPYIITETSLPMTKTVYLIRHAESDENRRKQCLKSSLHEILGKGKLPNREDVVASMELMNLSAQLDSNVSPRGQAQIDQLGKRIAEDDFVHKMGIQLVAHSPLKRARQTCYGMLQCVAPKNNDPESDNGSGGGDNRNNNNENDDDDPTMKGSKHPSVQRVVELDILSERTPIEWLPIQHDAFTKRIAQFEIWLSQQPEDVIAVVGHSLYFKDMLGLESKFNNVDVWSLEFDFTVENSVAQVRKDVMVANVGEKKKMMKKHFENFGNIIRKKSHDTAEFMSRTNSTDDGVDDDGSSFGLENRDESDTFTANNAMANDNTGRNTNSVGAAQTEMDGVSLEELELSRGWRQLKHHYRFDPNLVGK